MTDVLSTPRLVLRPFVPEDGAEMFRVWASDPQVTRFLRWTPHKDEAESLAPVSYTHLNVCLTSTASAAASPQATCICFSAAAG